MRSWEALPRARGAHNGYAAEADYGTEVVARRIAEARQSRRARALAPVAVPAPELFDATKSRTRFAAGRGEHPFPLREHSAGRHPRSDAVEGRSPSRRAQP